MEDNKLELVMSNQLDKMLEEGATEDDAKTYRELHACAVEQQRTENERKSANKDRWASVGTKVLDTAVFAAAFLVGMSFEEHGCFKTNFMKNLIMKVTRR